MPDSNNSYRAKVDNQRILQIRDICRELPQACSDFLSGIALNTGTFTRLAYAIDLRTFILYLYHERVAFAERKPTLWMDADFARVTISDLTAYTEYLTYYFREDEENEGTDMVKRALVNHELAIKRKLCSIRSLYDYLFKNQRIPSNVTLLLDLPKIHEKPIIRLDPVEVKRILALAESGEGLTEQQKRYQAKTSKRDFALISLFLGTGIRVSECVGINLSDVDMENNAFLVTRKGGNQAVLYFPPEVADALGEYLAERIQIQALPGHEDALFLSLQKKRISQRAVQLLVKKYAAIAAPLKPKISPHKLRSTFATNLYNATGDIYLVADVLGHSSVDTTRKHYADMTDARRRMAAEYVKLPVPTEQSATAASHSASDMSDSPAASDATDSPDQLPS